MALGHGARCGYVVTLPGGFHEARPGTARLSPPGSAPWVQIEPGGATCTLVDADGPFWTRVFARALRGPRRETAISCDHQAPAFRPPTDGFDLFAIGMTLTTFWAESEKSAAARVAQSQIDKDFSTISISRLADDLGLPRGRFAAQFLKATGFRPTEYRMLRRIEAAR